MKKRLFGIGVVLVIMFFVTAGVFATGQGEAVDYPTRAVSYVIPFNPGGQSDVTAQYQKPYLEEVLGVDVLIRHQPGAGGALAWSNLVKAKADGYTLSGSNVPHIIIQPLVRDDAGYETEELLPLYLFQTTPIGLAVSRDSEFDTLQEFVQYGVDNPGGITISGSGTHTGHHLAVLQLQHITGAEFTYIPATGAAPSVANFLGGHTDAIMANSDDLVAHADEMKILAIGTQDTFEPLADVPTFIAEGVDMTAGIDRGVSLPPDTPEAVVATLEAAFDEVTKNAELRAKMDELGFVTRTLGSEEYRAYLEEKKAATEAVLRELGEI